MSGPVLYVLLIGIDEYEPDEFPNGRRISSLNGCVADVLRVQSALEACANDRWQVSDLRLRRLTSPRKSRKPLGDPRPTFRNIVEALEHLAEEASPGDMVWIHFSGHGARVPTLFGELKGRGSARDEALVPADAACSDGGFIRDVWLGHAMQDLVRRELVVTLVLDCCHSGGGTRTLRSGQGAVSRSLGNIAVMPSRPDREVAASAQGCFTKPQPAPRGLAGLQSWLPSSDGYVFHAACNPDQYAFEASWPGGEPGGAFTRWMVEALMEAGEATTCRQVHEWVKAKVQSTIAEQTPMLWGDVDRLLFGAKRGQSIVGASVLQVDHGERRVLVDTGRAHGIRCGARLAVFSRDEIDPKRLDRHRAMIEIVELDATRSWAAVLDTPGKGDARQGDQAIVVDPGPLRLRRVVHLAAVEPAWRDALDAVRAGIDHSDRGFLEIGAKENAHFEVLVDPNGQVQINDAGGAPVPNLSPPLHIGEADAGPRLLARLDHLARFHNILELGNGNAASPLSHALRAELFRLPDGYDPMEPPQPLGEPLEKATVHTGQWLCLRLTNLSEHALKTVVLDLQPGWSVEQIVPAGGEYLSVDSHSEEVIALCPSLPDGYDEGTDLLKVIATLKPTKFRWLELPPLDQPPRTRRSFRAPPQGPLELLFAAMAVDLPANRALRPPPGAGGEWTTTELEVHVVRCD